MGGFHDLARKVTELLRPIAQHFGQLGIDAAKSKNVVAWQNLFGGIAVLFCQVGVLVKLGLEPPHLFEVFNGCRTAASPLRLGKASDAQSRPCDFMKVSASRPRSLVSG